MAIAFNALKQFFEKNFQRITTPLKSLSKTQVALIGTASLLLIAYSFTRFRQFSGPASLGNKSIKPSNSKYFDSIQSLGVYLYNKVIGSAKSQGKGDGKDSSYPEMVKDGVVDDLSTGGDKAADLSERLQASAQIVNNDEKREGERAKPIVKLLSEYLIKKETATDKAVLDLLKKPDLNNDSLDLILDNISIKINAMCGSNSTNSADYTSSLMEHIEALCTFVFQEEKAISKEQRSKAMDLVIGCLSHYDSSFCTEIQKVAFYDKVSSIFSNYFLLEATTQAAVFKRLSDILTLQGVSYELMCFIIGVLGAIPGQEDKLLSLIQDQHLVNRLKAPASTEEDTDTPLEDSSLALKEKALNLLLSKPGKYYFSTLITYLTREEVGSKLTTKILQALIANSSNFKPNTTQLIIMKDPLVEYIQTNKANAGALQIPVQWLLMAKTDDKILEQYRLCLLEIIEDKEFPLEIRKKVLSILNKTDLAGVADKIVKGCLEPELLSSFFNANGSLDNLATEIIKSVEQLAFDKDNYGYVINLFKKPGLKECFLDTIFLGISKSSLFQSSDFTVCAEILSEYIEALFTFMLQEETAAPVDSRLSCMDLVIDLIGYYHSSSGCSSDEKATFHRKISQIFLDRFCSGSATQSKIFKKLSNILLKQHGDVEFKLFVIRVLGAVPGQEDKLFSLIQDQYLVNRLKASDSTGDTATSLEDSSSALKKEALNLLLSKPNWLTQERVSTLEALSSNEKTEATFKTKILEILNKE